MIDHMSQIDFSFVVRRLNYLGPLTFLRPQDQIHMPYR